MFVGVARLTLQIPDSGSLKAKRQVLHRVTDRVKAKFNAAVAEVEDNDLWQKATIAVAVVGNDRRHVNEQLEKIIQFVDDMYVAPLISREMEILTMGDQLFSSGGSDEDGGMDFKIPKGDRSLAEAEGMADWDRRHEAKGPPSTSSPARSPTKLSLDEARAKARRLRNPREWEKK
jgi:uncharacterized protein